MGGGFFCQVQGKLVESSCKQVCHHVELAALKVQLPVASKVQGPQLLRQELERTSQRRQFVVAWGAGLASAVAGALGNDGQ